MQVGVIGAGAWGTALAAHCARMGHNTLVYAREPEVVADINDASVKENRTFLQVMTFTLGKPDYCLDAIHLIDLDYLGQCRINMKSEA